MPKLHANAGRGLFSCQSVALLGATGRFGGFHLAPVDKSVDMGGYRTACKAGFFGHLSCCSGGARAEVVDNCRIDVESAGTHSLARIDFSLVERDAE